MAATDSRSVCETFQLANQRFDECNIRGNGYRAATLRQLMRENYWRWELVALWCLYGPLDFILFSLVVFISLMTWIHGIPYGDYMLLTFAEVVMIVFTLIGFRMGYLVTKYFNLALGVFHDSSLDELIFGMTENPLATFNIDTTVAGNTGGVQAVELVRTSCASYESSPCVHDHHKRADNTTDTSGGSQTCCCTLMNGITSFALYVPEFVQTLQICLPVLMPYIVHHPNDGYPVSDHSGFLVFKIPNIDVFGNLDSQIKFAVFLYSGIVITVLLFFSILLSLCLREPWAVTILKLSQQAVAIAAYDLSEHRICGVRLFWIFSCIPHGLSKLLNMLIDVCPSHNPANDRVWVKRFFFAMKKCLDLSFIPLISHLVEFFLGKTGDSNDNYDDDDDEDAVLGVPVQGVTETPFVIVCIFLLYTLVYSFSAAFISVQDHVGDHPSTRREEKLLLHPRFLYKMIVARWAVILLATDAAANSGALFKSSNLHVRIFMVIILWCIVIAHAELLKSIWPRLQQCSCWRNNQQHRNVNSAYTDSSAASNSLPAVDSFVSDDNCSHHGSRSRSRHRSLEYPSNVRWFNLRHRGALVFVALFSTLILVEYFVTMSPGTLMSWTALLFSLVLTVTECLIMYLGL